MLSVKLEPGYVSLLGIDSLEVPAYNPKLQRGLANFHESTAAQVDYPRIYQWTLGMRAGWMGKQYVEGLRQDPARTQIDILEFVTRRHAMQFGHSCAIFGRLRQGSAMGDHESCAR